MIMELGIEDEKKKHSHAVTERQKIVENLSSFPR